MIHYFQTVNVYAHIHAGAAISAQMGAEKFLEMCKRVQACSPHSIFFTIFTIFDNKKDFDYFGSMSTL